MFANIRNDRSDLIMAINSITKEYCEELTINSKKCKAHSRENR